MTLTTQPAYFESKANYSTGSVSSLPPPLGPNYATVPVQNQHSMMESSGDEENPNQALLPSGSYMPSAQTTMVTKEQEIDPRYSYGGGKKATIASFCCSKLVSLLISLFIACAGLAMIICEAAIFPFVLTPSYENSNIILGIRVGVYVPLGLAIIYYLILTFVCGTFKYLIHNKDAENTYGWMDNLNRVKPCISMSVVCYHYETRIEHYTDSKGKHKTRTSTVRVNSFSESRAFDFQFYRDVSQPFILGGTTKEYVKLTLSHVKFINNQQTKQALDKSRLDIQIQNRWRDRYMDYNEHWSLPGFRKNLLARTNPSQEKSFFFSVPCYLIFSLFLMNSLYRFLFDRKCDEQSYQFVKEISVTPFQQEQAINLPTTAMWTNSAYGCVSYGVDGSNYQTTYNENQKDYIPPQPIGMPYTPPQYMPSQPGIYQGYQ